MPAAPIAAPLPAVPRRADLDGLRGLAVLSVFAVHSLPHEVSGGYIGVDVFFVLSGYLIASLTLAEQDAGGFSARAFYARRLRRLAPALLAVLFACLAFAACVAFPKDAREIGKHVMGGSAFVSNLVLWREAGYFDQVSELKPLLHLWSLGIEVQFYLLWPLFAWAFARAPRRTLAIAAAALLASFCLNVAFVGVKPKGTFFLPPTRFWELLVGVALACWEHAPGGGPLPVLARWTARLGAPWPPRMPALLAGCGAVLVGVPVWLLDPASRFPGWWALLPTLGTACLIAAGPRAWPNRVLLVNPVLAFYGRISYPLYLWHWPLLTLPRLLDRPLDPDLHVLLLCASVALATLTHYAVERPLARAPRTAAASGRLAAGLGLAAAAGAAIFASDGLLARYPERVRAIADVQVRTDYEAYRVGRCFLRSEQGPADFAPECVDDGAAAGGLLALWGDSHAASLYPGLAGLALARPLAQLTAAACPPLLPARLADNPHCGDVAAFADRRWATLRPATVVLAADWPRYAQASGPADLASDVQRRVEALRAAGVAEVVVIGPLPHWRIAPPRQLLAAWRGGEPLPERAGEAYEESMLSLDLALAAAARAGGARYVSILESLCDLRGCLLGIASGPRIAPVAFDESHLTAAGSARVAEAIAERLGWARGDAPRRLP